MSVYVNQAVHEYWGVSDQAVPCPQHVLWMQCILVYLCYYLAMVSLAILQWIPSWLFIL